MGGQGATGEATKGPDCSEGGVTWGKRKNPAVGGGGRGTKGGQGWGERGKQERRYGGAHW